MRGEKPTFINPTVIKTNSPTIAALRKKLLEKPLVNYDKLHRIDDLTEEQFSQMNKCSLDQANTVSLLYKQLSLETSIPLRICNSILNYPGESVQILTDRLIALVNKKTAEL
jgi:hypothetical protein